MSFPHWSRAWWECPCGREEPKPNAKTTPVKTIVSLREPWCPHCRREYRPEYRRDDESDAA